MTLPRRIQKPKRRENRVRCPAHLKWVRSHFCCVPGCQRQPIEAAHTRRGLPNGEQAGMGQKPGDQWAISLCVEHHDQQHNVGEKSFEEWHKIDMKELALEFAAKSPHRRKLI